MFGLGWPEILVIALVVGVLLFGSGKILGLARSLGRFGGEFKKGKADIERELKDAEASVIQSESSTQEGEKK